MLNVHSTVTDFTPTQGSVNGGTLITVTGGRFSDDCLHHPIRIGSADCKLETCSESKLTCRTVKRMKGNTPIVDEETSDFIVFLRASEEAKITASTKKFSYKTSKTPSLIAVTPTFADGEYTVTFTGTGFDGD